jgi:hypothetical protein
VVDLVALGDSTQPGRGYDAMYQVVLRTPVPPQVQVEIPVLSEERLQDSTFLEAANLSPS